MKIEEIIEKLHQPIPNHRLSQKTVKGNRIDYVAWQDLCEILDERLGMGSWSWKIKDIQHFGNRLVLTGGRERRKKVAPTQPIRGKGLRGKEARTFTSAWG